METPISADNPVTTGADNPATEPASQVNGTGANNGQGQGAPPADDLFSGVDPNKLPPEAKAAYDSMLKDYRTKTARISETTKSEVAKATQAYKEKVALYDQIAGQEEFVKQWNDYVQKASNPNADPADPVSKLETMVQEMKQKIEGSEIKQVTDAFADAVNEKGEKINPDFDRLNEIMIGNLSANGQQQPFSLLRACIELAPGKSPHEKLTAGYKNAKAQYDAIFEAGRKAGLGRVNSKVQNGTNAPSGMNGEITTTDKRPKTAREAMELARKGIRVSA